MSTEIILSPAPELQPRCGREAFDVVDLPPDKHGEEDADTWQALQLPVYRMRCPALLIATKTSYRTLRVKFERITGV